MRLRASMSATEGVVSAKNDYYTTGGAIFGPVRSLQRL